MISHSENQSDNLCGCFGEILFCLCRLYGRFCGDRAAHSRKNCVNGALLKEFRRYIRCAAQCNHRDARLLRHLSNAGRCFAHCGLHIGFAFSGQHEVSLCHQILHVHQTEHLSDTG